MDIYFVTDTATRVFTNPLSYVGTSLSDAIASVGEFQKHEAPWEEWTKGATPTNMTALPGHMESEMVKFYINAVGWVSIVKVSFEEPVETCMYCHLNIRLNDHVWMDTSGLCRSECWDPDNDTALHEPTRKAE